VSFHPLLERRGSRHVPPVARQHLFEGNLRGMGRLEAAVVQLERTPQPAGEHAGQRMVVVTMALAHGGDEGRQLAGELVILQASAEEHRKGDDPECRGVTARRAGDGPIDGRSGHAVPRGRARVRCS
jgi:hypothetical protein